MNKKLHCNYHSLLAKLLMGVCTIVFLDSALQQTVLGNELKAEQKLTITAVDNNLVPQSFEPVPTNIFNQLNKAPKVGIDALSVSVSPAFLEIGDQILALDSSSLVYNFPLNYLDLNRQSFDLIMLTAPVFLTNQSNKGFQVSNTSKGQALITPDLADSIPTTLLRELKSIASAAPSESNISSFSNLTPLPGGSKLLKAESQEELRVEAEIQKDEKDRDRSGWALMPKVGTLGIGAEVFKSITDSFNLRAGFSRFQIGDEGFQIATTGQEGIRIDYNGELRIGSSFTLSGDFYPFNDWFFLTVGLSVNDNRYSFSRAALARLPNSQFVAAGVRGKVEYNPVAPTIGIGFGNPVRRGQFFGFFFNAGVMFQGAGKVSLEGGVGTDSELQTIRETLTIDELEIWPVAQVGISFQF